MNKTRFLLAGSPALRILPLATTLAVALLGTPAAAQNLPDRLGAGTPPPGTVATVDEAHALVINPAGLGFMEGPQLILSHSGLDYVGPTGASDSAWAGMRFLERLSLAAGMDWIRPASKLWDLPTFSAPINPVQPLLGASVFRFSTAGAFRVTEELSVGVAYRHVLGLSKRTYGLGTLDLGVSFRPFRYLALGATLEQANSPFAGNDRMLRSVRMGVAVRPLWERLTFSTEFRLDEHLRLDTNLLTRVELLPGASFYLSTFWMDMLAGSGKAAERAAKDDHLSDMPYLGDQFGAVGGSSLSRITLAAGIQFDLEHFGGGLVGGWTPGSTFLTTWPRPDPREGGVGSLGGLTAWGRISAETYPSMLRRGRQAVAIRVEGELEGPSPDNPVEALLEGLGLQEGPGETLAQLDRAVRDPRVRVVLLKIRGLKVGWGRIVEIRQRVEALRRAGKRVVAYMESGGDEEYHVAAAADRIYMAPSGVLGLDGFAVQIQFLAAAMDRLGVHAETVAAGKYKSAPEQLTRTEPSQENLEVQRSILDGLYETHVSAIAHHRHVPADAVRAILDRGMLSPEEAIKEKLIDGLAYEDELGTRVGRDIGGGEMDFDEDFGNSTLRQWRWAAPKAIAVVPLVGEIRQGRNRPGLLGFGGGAGADDVIAALEAAGEDDNIKAVVLRVDSPGGDSLASDLIWNAVRKLRKKKPVVSSYGDLAASGGYYASCGTDLIVSEPTTLTGSIGVFSLTFEVADLLDRFGVTTYEETRGKLAGGGLFRPMSEEERAAVKKFVGVTYDQFLDRVKDGRKLPREKVEEIAQGRVWMGAQAKEIGLVDELGGLPDAIELAKGMVGLRGDDSVEVQVVTGDDNPVSRWSSALNASVGLITGRTRSEERVREATRLMLGDPALVETAMMARESRSLMLMPYTIKIR